MAEAWATKTPAREAGDPAAKRPRVLVVDDEPGIRRALARLLTRDGLLVSCVATAAEALAAFADAPPDLVVLDLGLPDLPGTELCERIRSRAEGGDVPIVVLTGHNDEEAIARAFDAGASDFASKAEPLAVLVHRVRFLLRARSQLAALRESEARLSEAQHLAQLASFRWHLTSRQLTGSPELWRVLGAARGSLPRLDARERDALAAQVRAALRSGRVVGGELRTLRQGGAPRTLRYRMQLALDGQGEAVALEGVVQDVTAWRQSEERASFLAEHDAVTGLPNAAGLERALDRLLESRASAALESHGRPSELAVIAVGLDGFERVAETLGRDAAHALLREAARRLGAAAGNGFVARASDSQFAVVAPSLSAHGDDALALAQRAIAAFGAPIQLANHEVTIAALAGIARTPADGADTASLLRSAERALAQARLGGAPIQAHSPASSAAALRRFTLASRLRGAIERGELVLHYQPKIALASAAVVGFEGLVRWREPELGLLAPSEFIPVAEESGLVAMLSDWVVREACRQLVAWRDAGLGDVPIAVNLSARQFRRDGVAARIAEILRETGAKPELLGVEVTESVLLADPEHAIGELQALRALGVELALDDFGTGFSSLSYLRKLPVQIVKIDREFVAEIASREDAAALAASIVAMAKALWLRVVAEGVEREAERDLLAIWGCEEAQGFLFSPAVPAPEAEQLWRARGRAPQRDDSR